jgi:hypothetical protein
MLASLEVERGHLSNLRLSLFVSRSDGFGLNPSVVLTGATPLAAPDGAPYYVYEAHVTGPPGEALRIELSPAASPEERRKGFDLNFSCLTALRECRHVCETMPTAWKDLPSERHIRYSDGREKLANSECRERIP